MSSSTSEVADLYISIGDEDKEGEHNNALDAASPVIAGAINVAYSGGTSLRLFGGVLAGKRAVATDLTVTDNTTNYVYFQLSDGTFHVSTGVTQWGADFAPAAGYVQLYKIAIAGGAWTVTEFRDAFAQGGGGGGGGGGVALQFACSDDSTALTTASNVARVRNPYEARTIAGVRAWLKTASSSGAVSIDIKKNGTTILSTALTIDAGQLTSTTATTPAVLSVTSIADDDVISADITAPGTGAIGLGISVLLS